ncbi:hypothetical protein EAG14_14425 [Acidovorax sp. 1608163]|uniref:hypothetical protein n=1 Tax=Acidovorax sp. 1608163 TaxID=2478662 RepID=UPI000EF7545A|nr:hypothetical protein [Acidovorax sp. 1608163]AYM97064.1 hypothetical protein EAG14_14425 [Acidovorax sp. 1608163]
MNSCQELKDLNVEQVARAIEADAGESLPGLREALAEAKAGRGRAEYTFNAVIGGKGIAQER